MQLQYTVSNGDTITLPLQGTVNVLVDWGQVPTSTNTYITAGNYNHTYTTGGTYTVTITGTLDQFGNGSIGYSNPEKLVAVLSLTGVGLKSLHGAFKGATNLVSVPTTLPTTVTDLRYAFYGATSFNDTNIVSWDMTNVTDISYMFFLADTFNRNIYNWNFTDIHDYNFPLYGARNFNQPISGWLLNKILNFHNY
jgi:hypothetical protein